MHQHVDHAVLQRPEALHRYAELLTRAQVLVRKFVRLLHRAGSLGAQGRGAVIEAPLQRL
ncbi:hypothetical protein D3C87_2197800 [compost metagenome]